MTVTAVQENAVGSPGGATTRSFTLPAAPTAGNLLIFTLAGDKNTGALTLTGFTQIFQLLATDVSLYYYWKISDGTETTINPTWATASPSGSFGRYAEYDDPAVASGEWQIVGQASTTTSGANVTSQTTGTTGTLTNAGLAIAIACIDSANSVVAGTTAWTNSYNSVWVTPSNFGGGSTGGALHVADKQVTAGGTTNSTWSYTASDINRDQVSAAVVVFAKVSQEVVLECRADAAGEASAIGFAYALSPEARAEGAAQAATDYGFNIVGQSIALAGAAPDVPIVPVVTAEARADAAGHASAQVAAVPGDITLEARADAAGSAAVPVVVHIPPPTPVHRLYTVPAEKRIYVVPREVGDVNNRWDKDPSDKLDYGWDWSVWLDEGETITSHIIAPPAGLTMTLDAHTDTRVTMWLEGGTADTTYTIPGKITTSAGRTVERNILIRVRER